LENKMGTGADWDRLRRSRLTWRQTPTSQIHRPAAPVSHSQSQPTAIAPVKNWPGRETLADAERLNDEQLYVLLPALPVIGRALQKCHGVNPGCLLPICAVCARDYRVDPIAQLHALAGAYPGPHEVATIYLKLFAPDSLADADLRRTGEMLRKRLDRAGFKGAILVGGIEVAWQENWQRWLLHAHVLAIGVDPTAWQRLEAALKNSGTWRPIEVDELRDPDKQLSYCIKFVTYHQPGRRLVPLPADRLVELAAWQSQYRFEDFLFAYGARRRGGQLVVDK
jgi:hypothetical protein